MQIHPLVLAGMIGLAGVAARRSNEPAEAPPLPPREPARVTAITMPTIAPILPAFDDEPEDTGVEVAQLLADANRHVAELARTHNAIAGHVANLADGDALAGVTVIVSSPAEGDSHTSITDEHGDFAITDLAAGSYLVTLYYADVTVENNGVAVSSLEATWLATSLDLSPHSNWCDDCVNIAIPSRAFEEAISFSGGTSLENQYVIDDDGSDD